MSALPDCSALDVLIRSSGVCCCLWHQDEKNWRVSPGLVSVLGLATEWCVWSDAVWRDTLNLEDAPVFLPLLRALSAGEAFSEHHIRLKTRHGAYLRFACHGKIENIGPLLLLNDITTQSQIESALHDSQMRLNSLYDSAPIAIILWSKEGRITAWNDMASQTFGHAREKVIGKKLVPLLIHSDDFPIFSQAISESVAENNGKDVICRSLTLNGDVLRCRWRSVPLRTRKGALTGIFSLAQDVTAELLAAENLLAGKQSAERLSQAKSEFLAVVGHELRTPLNGILGMAQLLQVYELDDEVQGFVQTINDSGQKLLLIINAIMRYADADRVSRHTATQIFSLHELLLFGTQVFEFQANQKGLTLALLFDPGLPKIVEGDEDALKSIIANLSENAVKFTENGSIRISANLLAIGAENCQIEISIQDTGIGMTPEFMEGLYQPFRQAENAILRKHGGVGLGLALVRKLVERIGGEIAVISVPGEGSTFTVRFSLKLCLPEE